MSDQQSGSGESANQQQSSGDDQQQNGDAQNQQQPNQQSQSTPSANQILKDFVKREGISVEDLLTDYTKLRDSNKTDHQRKDEKITKLASDLESERTTNRDLRAHQSVTSAATKAKAVDSDAIYALIKGELEFDKDGKPTNVDAAITKLRDDKPHLFRGADGSGDGGEGGSNDAPNTSMNSLIAKRLGRRG